MKRILLLIPFTEKFPYECAMRQSLSDYLATRSEVTAYFIQLRDQAEPIVVAGNNIWLNGVESIYPGVLIKTMRALEYCITAGVQFDWVVRTNISTAIDFAHFPYSEASIHEYAGSRVGVHDGVSFVGGTDITISRRCAELLLKHASELNYSLLDDIAIALVFAHLQVSPYQFQVSRRALSGTLPSEYLNEALSSAPRTPGMRTGGYTYRHRTADRDADARQLATIVNTFAGHKRIAICYFGLTRSVHATFSSHHNLLYSPLRAAGHAIDVYMHTWRTDTPHYWWTPAPPLDYEEYRLLKPDVYKIEEQKEFIDTINFGQVFDEELYRRVGDAPEGEWHPRLILNHLCALESQKRAFQMAQDSRVAYDHVLFVRPDVRIISPFDPVWLSVPYPILIPDFEHNNGYNDKFAALSFTTADLYAKRIDEITEFRKTNGRIVSEKYVKFIIEKYYGEVACIAFRFEIIR